MTRPTYFMEKDMDTNEYDVCVSDEDSLCGPHTLWVASFGERAVAESIVDCLNDLAMRLSDE